MRRHGKKLTALLLALCMALGLAACGGGGEDKKQDGASPLSGTVYVPEFMDLDLDADDITAGCCDGTNIYVVAEKNTEKEAANPFTGETYTAYSSEYCIYKVPLDGSAPVELENYEPSYSFDSSDEGWFTIDSLRAGADGSLWVSERADVYDFDPPENFDPEKDDPYNYLNSTTVELERKLDATGKEIDRVDISTLAEKLETDWIYRKVLDAEGYMYASNNTGVFVLDREMNVLFSITDESWGDLILLTDGSVAMMRYGDEGRSVQVIDRASKGWGKSYPIAEGNPNSIYSGAGEYLFYYESGDSLYGYKAETSSGERLELRGHQLRQPGLLQLPLRRPGGGHDPGVGDGWEKGGAGGAHRAGRLRPGGQDRAHLRHDVLGPAGAHQYHQLQQDQRQVPH